MPSSDSRPASVAGKPTVAGVGGVTWPVSVVTPPEAGVSSVIPANSLTLPVTWRWSPIFGYAAPLPAKTNSASEVSWLDRSREPPVPGVWM